MVSWRFKGLLRSIFQFCLIIVNDAVELGNAIYYSSLFFKGKVNLVIEGMQTCPRESHPQWRHLGDCSQQISWEKSVVLYVRVYQQSVHSCCFACVEDLFLKSAAITSKGGLNLILGSVGILGNATFRRVKPRWGGRNEARQNTTCMPCCPDSSNFHRETATRKNVPNRPVAHDS